MGKRVQIALAVVFAAAVGFAVWHGFRKQEKEPIYYGKPLGYWISHPQNIPQIPGVVRTLGTTTYHGRIAFASEGLPLETNAIPCLIQYLDRYGDAYHRSYRRAWYKVPAWIRKRLSNPLAWDQIRMNIIATLRHGPDFARPAIPSLMRILKEDCFPPVRICATSALGWFPQESRPVKTALIQCLTDRDPMVRDVAADALLRANFTTGNEVATALRNCLSHRDYSIRLWATNYIRNNSLMVQPNRTCPATR